MLRDENPGEQEPIEINAEEAEALLFELHNYNGGGNTSEILLRAETFVRKLEPHLSLLQDEDLTETVRQIRNETIRLHGMH